jgi:hypothetical protein
MFCLIAGAVWVGAADGVLLVEDEEVEPGVVVSRTEELEDNELEDEVVIEPDVVVSRTEELEDNVLEDTTELDELTELKDDEDGLEATTSP